MARGLPFCLFLILFYRHLKGLTSIRNKFATGAGQHKQRNRGHTLMLAFGLKSLSQYSSDRRQNTPQIALRLRSYFYLYQVLTRIFYYQRLKSNHSFAERQDIFEHQNFNDTDSIMEDISVLNIILSDIQVLLIIRVLTQLLPDREHSTFPLQKAIGSSV